MRLLVLFMGYLYASLLCQGESVQLNRSIMFVDTEGHKSAVNNYTMVNQPSV